MRERKTSRSHSRFRAIPIRNERKRQREKDGFQRNEVGGKVLTTDSTLYTVGNVQKFLNKVRGDFPSRSNEVPAQANDIILNNLLRSLISFFF